MTEFQEKIFEDESDLICLVKARQVGGTTAFMSKAGRKALDGENVIVVSPTMYASKAGVREFFGSFPKNRSDDLVRFNGGGMIKVISRDHIQEYLKKDNLGEDREADVIFVDQADDLPEGLLDQIRGLRKDRELWVCGTPMKPKSKSEMFDFYQQGDVSSYHVSAEDVDHLEEDWKERMKNMMTELQKKLELDAEFVEEEEYPDDE